MAIHEQGPIASFSAARSVLALVVVAVFGVASVACAKEDPQSATGSNDGFVVELASEIGPHAFTPPVDVPNATGSQPSCDKQAFIRDLQGRPDALREWAKVLNMPESAVPAYVNGLETAVLAADLKVTNHGLKDGKAYPRASILTSGTAVLVDTNAKFPMQGATPTYKAPLTTTTTASGVAAYPVTRCKCGNPLLPPPPPGSPTPSNGTFPPGTHSTGSTTHSTSPGTTGTVRHSPGTTSTGPSSSVAPVQPSTSSSSSTPVAPTSVSSTSTPVTPGTKNK